MRRAATLLLLALALAAPARGDEPASPPAGAPSPRNWFIIPVATYLPETGFGGGGSFGTHLHLEGAPRATSFFATALYTTEGQGLLDLAVDASLPGGAVVAARGRALHYPDRYYGLGPDSRDGAMEHFTRRGLELVTSFEAPVPWVPGLRLGPRIDLRAEEIVDRDPGSALAAESVPGASRSGAVALGGQVTWDTRDGAFWPSRGTYAQAWSVYAPERMSRTGAYGRTVLELRHFVPLPSRRVLGLFAYGEHARGEIPFTLLPRIGNTRFLRGIREGRYRDRVDWAVQAELRSPLFWRISGTAFAALGDVASRIQDVRLGAPKAAGGLGLRYRLTDEGVNVRLDVAVSRFGVMPYVLVLEAF
jgi:hypothetical protein